MAMEQHTLVIVSPELKTKFLEQFGDTEATILYRQSIHQPILDQYRQNFDYFLVEGGVLC